MFLVKPSKPSSQPANEQAHGAGEFNVKREKERQKKEHRKHLNKDGFYNNATAKPEQLLTTVDCIASFCASQRNSIVDTVLLR